MQKGGTLIAESVEDLATHERYLRSDRYRPAGCPRCGEQVHCHEHRARLLLGEAKGSTDIVIYRCADHDNCGAVWRILPRFLARHLWRAWSTVARTVADQADDEQSVVPGLIAAAAGPPIPKTTRTRWRNRLVTSAAMVVAVLATAMDVPALGAVVKQVGYLATRGELVGLFAERLASQGQALGTLGSLVHRLAPGVRLM